MRIDKSISLHDKQKVSASHKARAVVNPVGVIRPSAFHSSFLPSFPIDTPLPSKQWQHHHSTIQDSILGDLILLWKVKRQNDKNVVTRPSSALDSGKSAYSKCTPPRHHKVSRLLHGTSVHSQHSLRRFLRHGSTKTGSYVVKRSI